MTYFIALCTLAWLALRFVALLRRMVKTGVLVSPVEAAVVSYIQKELGVAWTGTGLCLYNLISLGTWAIGMLCIFATFSPAVILISSALFGGYLVLAATQWAQLRLAVLKMPEQQVAYIMQSIDPQPA